MDKRIAIEPRREEDRELRKLKCPVHDLIQDEAKEHREMVCRKIGKKADEAELKNVVKTMALVGKIIAILLPLCVVGLAGAFAWIKSDLGTIKTEAIAAVKTTDNKIDEGFKTLHRRISENADIRESNDKEQIKQMTDQTKQLEDIKSSLKLLDYRMIKIEDHKNGKK